MWLNYAVGWTSGYTFAGMTAYEIITGSEVALNTDLIGVMLCRNIYMNCYNYSCDTMTRLSAVIRKEKNVYVSWCPELDIASQGKTIEKAVANLKEAVELYLEDEDAKLPETTPLLTTFEVVSHAKTARAVGT